MLAAVLFPSSATTATLIAWTLAHAWSASLDDVGSTPPPPPSETPSSAQPTEPGATANEPQPAEPPPSTSPAAGEDPTRESPPPSDAPPSDAPPSDAPPSDAPPSDAPPSDAPPSDAPPSDAPPSDAPPSDAPPSDAPPSDAPPSDAPPSDAPPSDAPPSDAPSGHAPSSNASPQGGAPSGAAPSDAPPSEPGDQGSVAPASSPADGLPATRKPPRIDGPYIGFALFPALTFARVNTLRTDDPFGGFGASLRFGQTIFPWLALGLQLTGIAGLQTEGSARQTITQIGLLLDATFVPMPRRSNLTLRGSFGIGGGSVRRQGVSARSGMFSSMFGIAIRHEWFPGAAKHRATRGGGFGVGPELGWLGVTPPAAGRPMGNTIYFAIAGNFYFGY